jgi:LemA protein
MQIAIAVFVILVVAVFLILTITLYNGIISLRNQVDRAWANIEVVLKQRHDEIPQLVEVLEQTALFEKQVIQKILDARARYGSSRNENQKVQASRDLTLALNGMFALGEAYPELKSNSNFTHLQTRLSELESRLTDRREVYNEAVTNWNTKIFRFPEILFKSMMKLEEKPLFQVKEFEKQKAELRLNVGG